MDAARTQHVSIQGVRLEKGRSGIPVMGTLSLTQHLILFQPNDSAGTNASVADPDIEQIWYSTIVLIDRKFPSPDGLHPVYIICRHFIAIKLFFARDVDAASACAALHRGINITSINQLYAFAYRRETANAIPDAGGWSVFDPAREYGRMGVGTTSQHWRLTSINQNYEYSPTYPKVIAVPSRISDNVLKHISGFRSKMRIPALSYIHWSNKISITRSSQPMVGIKQNRSIQDEKLVEAIFSSSSANPVPGTTHLILDARPAANAIAQTAMGAGTESQDNYRGSKIIFLGIENIHVVRDSMNRMFDAFVSLDAPSNSSSAPVSTLGTSSMASTASTHVPRSTLDRSGWLRHLRTILDGALMIVQNVHVNHAHVLVHCSDGWDRTAQLSSLAQLCLDPYYRTIDGFQVLIEKEWVSFGHKFRDRCGHLCHESRSGDASSFGGSGATGANGNGFGGNDGVSMRGQSVASQLQVAGKNMSASLTNAAKSFLGSSKKGLLNFAAGATGSSSPFSFGGLGSGSGGMNPYGESGINMSSESAGGGYTSEPSSGATSSSVGNLVSSETLSPNNVAPKEISPVFPQFLDALYQLWTQFPTHFEFDERLLAFLFVHVYSCQFGSFLFNNERERNSFVYKASGNVASATIDSGTGIQDATVSIWDYINANRDMFINALYSPSAACDPSALRSEANKQASAETAITASPLMGNPLSQSNPTATTAPSSNLPTNASSGPEMELSSIRQPASNSNEPNNIEDPLSTAAPTTGSGIGRIDSTGTAGSISTDQAVLFPSSSNLRYWTSFYIKHVSAMASPSPAPATVPITSTTSSSGSMFAMDPLLVPPISQNQPPLTHPATFPRTHQATSYARSAASHANLGTNNNATTSTPNRATSALDTLLADPDASSTKPTQNGVTNTTDTNAPSITNTATVSDPVTTTQQDASPQLDPLSIPHPLWQP